MSEKLIRFLLFLMILLGFVFTTVCKKSQEGLNPATQQQIERAAGYTAATVADLGGKVFGSAIAIIGVSAGQEPTDSVMKDLSYNPDTGWWNFSIKLDNNQNASINMQFLDSAGNFHKFFSRSTDRIISNGEGSGSEGSFTYDFTITGVNPTSDTYTINGSGTTTYQGETTSWTVDNMTFNKLEDEYPENGSLAITIEGVTITVTFNGSQTVQVTYTYKGHSYTFTINLETGAIS